MLKVTRIEKIMTGYGHYRITVTASGLLEYSEEESREVEDHEISCISTDTIAIDCYFDQDYDSNLDNEDEDSGFYNCRYDAAYDLADEVFRKNLIDNDFEIEIYGLLSKDEVKLLRESIRNGH